MPIKDWPEQQRPREKLLRLGAEALTDSELLAIFLRIGVKGKSAVDLADDMLAEFGSLQALFNADQKRFCQVNGLGEAKYAQLQSVLEMARRHFFETLKRGEALTSPEATRQYLCDRIKHFPYEMFVCLFLDNQHRIIELEEMFRGTIDSASVYPREVLKRALHHNAAAVIFAHNHPSGINEPSQSDREITTKLQHGLALVDIRVLDHFIIADGEPFSFAEHGLL